MLRIPVVLDDASDKPRYIDVYSRMLRERAVFLTSPVTDKISSLIVAELLYLEAADPEKPVRMYINSPGGSVPAGLAIYDTMQQINCDVETVCVGHAASMGAVLLAAGSKGSRFAAPYARIMIHQPWGGVRGMAEDVEIQAEEILDTRKRLNEILAKHTGQDIERINVDTERDRYMSSAEAMDYGVVDSIWEGTGNNKG